jgi:hypothetical protein
MKITNTNKSAATWRTDLREPRRPTRGKQNVNQSDRRLIDVRSLDPEQKQHDPSRGAILTLMKLLVKLNESVSGHGGNARPEARRTLLSRWQKQT